MSKRDRVLALCAALAALSTCNVTSAQSCSITPSNLCQVQNDTDGFRTRTITIEDGLGEDPVARPFAVHCPNVGNEPTGAIPPVLLLHGGFGNPGEFAEDLIPQGFSDNTHTTDLGEFFLVMPAAYDAAGPEGPQWNNRTDDLDVPRYIKDVKFIDDLLDCLISEYDNNDEDDPPWTIDPSRVYAAGFSDGGSMVNRLGVEITERFAAVASVSGRLAFVYDDTYQAGRLFSPSRFLPYLMIHGDGARRPGCLPAHD